MDRRLPRRDKSATTSRPRDAIGPARMPLGKISPAATRRAVVAAGAVRSGEERGIEGRRSGIVLARATRAAADPTRSVS